jgi:hypothetical protein
MTTSVIDNGVNVEALLVSRVVTLFTVGGAGQ